MAKPGRRDGAKERYWRGMLRRWRRSGLTGRDFCAEHGLSEPSFYAWRREIARRDGEKAASARTAERALPLGSTPRTMPAFVKVTVDSSAAVPPTAVPPTAVPPTVEPPAIEVVLAERRVLRVRAGFDADLLRQLLRLLEEPAC